MGPHGRPPKDLSRRLLYVLQGPDPGDHPSPRESGRFLRASSFSDLRPRIRAIMHIHTCFLDRPGASTALATDRVSHAAKQKKKRSRVGGPPGGRFHSHRTPGRGGSPCSQWPAAAPLTHEMGVTVAAAAAILNVPNSSTRGMAVYGHPRTAASLPLLCNQAPAPSYPGAIFAPRRLQVGQARPTASSISQTVPGRDARTRISARLSKNPHTRAQSLPACFFRIGQSD